MSKERPLPRQNLAKNLKALIQETGLSGPEVAKRAGVDRKTINNQLNGRYDPQPDMVDAVAKVFNLNGWQLLAPNLDIEAATNGRLQELFELFSAADEVGRENILRVAEMAVKRPQK